MELVKNKKENTILIWNITSFKKLIIIIIL